MSAASIRPIWDRDVGRIFSINDTPSLPAWWRCRGLNGRVCRAQFSTTTCLVSRFSSANGIPVNLRVAANSNGDQVLSDRPIDAPRNSINLPNRYNVDARYSRRFGIRGAMAAEVIAEVENYFQLGAGVGRERHHPGQRRGRAEQPAADERR